MNAILFHNIYHHVIHSIILHTLKLFLPTLAGDLLQMSQGMGVVHSHQDLIGWQINFFIGQLYNYHRVSVSVSNETLSLTLAAITY